MMGEVKIVRASSVPEALYGFNHSLDSLPKVNSRRSLAASSDENELIALFGKVRCGFMSNHMPQHAEDGTGTVYILKDGAGEPAAVFKPHDEEAVPFSGVESDSIKLGDEVKPGLAFGEGYLKEVAAFLLDGERFHDVPPTTVFIFSHRNFFKDGASNLSKIGSLQKYVPHKCSAEDMGWNMFPVKEVHRIGVLDCRILNNDRHLGNILVSQGKDGFYRLTPIDHGLSFPAEVSGASFEWLSFPQARQPFDAETLDFIERLNPVEDVRLLQKSLPVLRPECLDVLRFSTTFLKKAARCKLNLYQIGCMMSRYLNMDEPCELEKLKMSVDVRAAGGVSDAKYWKIVDEEMDNFFNHWKDQVHIHVNSVAA